LPYIAGPITSLKRGQGLLGQRSSGRGVPGEEVPGKERDISSPISQGRNLDADHPEPPIEIPAELSVGYYLLEWGSRGGNHPDVYYSGPGISSALDFSTLEQMQQPGLNRQRNPVDRFEKKRPGMRQLDPSDPGTGSAVTSNFAEELGFEIFRPNRSAVDRDERPLRPLAPGMEQLGHELLADTGFSHDYHRRIARRDRVDELEQRFHSGIRAHQASVTGPPARSGALPTEHCGIPDEHQDSDCSL
jgi:hypothetical protein